MVLSLLLGNAYDEVIAYCENDSGNNEYDYGGMIMAIVMTVVFMMIMMMVVTHIDGRVNVRLSLGTNSCTTTNIIVIVT